MPSLEEPALYEDIAYAQIIEHYYKGPVPKIAEYMNITIKGFVFPDCMEITLLHLCNMILY